MLRLDKGFCYLKPVAVSVQGSSDTRRAVSGGASSEARAPAPPPSDKSGATPPGDAYAPLGAVAAAAHHRPPPGASRRAPAACTAPTRSFTTAQRPGASLHRQLSTPKKTRKRPQAVGSVGLRNHAASPDTDENNEAQTNAEPF